MGLTLEKLKRDYLKADEINDMILTQQLTLTQGNSILTSFIVKIQKNVALLDVAKHKELQDRIDKIRSEIEPEIKKIHEYYTNLKSNDSYDEENRKIQVNNKNHEMLQNILFEIQNFLFNAGMID